MVKIRTSSIILNVSMRHWKQTY